MSSRNSDFNFTLLGLILLIPPIYWYITLVMTDLWAWFLVPLGVPGIGQWHAVGVLLLLEVTRSSGIANHLANERATPLQQIKFVVARLIAIAIAWGAGALIHGLGGVS